MKMFSIYDSKVGVYDRPWTALNKGAAIRAILDALSDINHPYAKWPADFTLFEIGEWDEQTGKFAPLATNMNCGVLIELASLAPKSSTNSGNLRDVSQSNKNLLTSEEASGSRQ